MDSQYKTRKETLKLLGVHYHTLYKMARNGEIESTKIGGNRMYNVTKYLKEKNMNSLLNKRKICYCRVSSKKQKEDLERQIKYMTEKFPTYELITDIGSGLNFERKGLSKIIDYAIKGEIECVVITYKDRLARIGYELIEMLIKKYSEGQIKIINKNEEETPQEELSKDLIAIMNVYVAKVNGLRKYKTAIKKELKTQK